MKRFAILSSILFVPASIGVSFGFYSCSKSESNNAAAGGAPAAGGAAGEAGQAGQTAAETLSDAQVIQVLIAANSGEITLAQLALTHASSTQVKSFAQMMIDDHTSAKNQTMSLASMDSITPANSGTSQMLEANTTAMQAELGAASAAAFDGSYMRGQVDMHQQLLTIIDRQLLPSATAPNLKALIQTTRATVSSHLAEARSIVSAL